MAVKTIIPAGYKACPSGLNVRSFGPYSEWLRRNKRELIKTQKKIEKLIENEKQIIKAIHRRKH